MKIVGFILLGIIGLLVLGFAVNALRVLFFPGQVATNMVDTMYDANAKVINADNAIYNYEWFKQKKADIDATKRQLINARRTVEAFEANAGARKDWTFEDKSEHARLNTVVLGLENNLENQIGDYNARASMATRNIFEDNVLPSYIDALTFVRQ